MLMIMQYPMSIWHVHQTGWSFCTGHASHVLVIWRAGGCMVIRASILETINWLSMAEPSLQQCRTGDFSMFNSLQSPSMSARSSCDIAWHHNTAIWFLFTNHPLCPVALVCALIVIPGHITWTILVTRIMQTCLPSLHDTSIQGKKQHANHNQTIELPMCNIETPSQNFKWMDGYLLTGC